MFCYLNCNQLYLPISTFLSIYLPTYLRGWASGSVLPNTDKITRSYAMRVAGRFDTSKFACQNDLPGKLPNKSFDGNYLVLPL